jgi:membrane fusion protein (multidrug efflux system)
MKKSQLLVSALIILSLIIFGVVQSNSTEGTDNVAQGSKAAATKAASPQTSHSKTAAAVRVEIVAPRRLVNTLALTGVVTPTRTARMASPGEGPVLACPTASCLVREGDRVKEGELLLRIGRNKTAEAQLAASEQTLKESEAELRRIEQLVEVGAIPGAQLDGARSAYENARAQRAKAMENTLDYSVSAPWNGIVSKVHVAEGDYVVPRAPLIEIFDPQSLVVQFAVPEALSTAVRSGQRVTVQLDAYPGQHLNGAITRVYPELDKQMHTRTVEATLSNDISLLPGMFARIQVLLAEYPDALSVPPEAILTTPQQQALVFVVEEGQARQRLVQPGIEDQGRVQIVSGLKTGDQVVIAGYEKLKDGTAVQIRGEQSR